MLLVVASELGGLESNLLKDVIDEGVHDLHRPLGDASLRMHLLEDSVDVDRESLSPAATVLVSSGSGLGDALLRGRLLGSGSALSRARACGLLGSHVFE